MPISIPSQTFSSILPWIKETIANSLTDRKIVSVVAVIFAGIALYFAIKQYWQESKPPTSTLLGKTPSGDESVESDERENEVKDLIAQLNEDSFSSLKDKLECAKRIGKFLEGLDLTESEITDEQLQEVLTSCPNLKKLNLSFCKNLTDEAIKHLPKNLTELDLTSCINLRNAAIKHLPKTLTLLNLYNCNNLTDAAIQHLPENLRVLNLAWCKRLTDSAIIYLSKMTFLKEIDLRNCDNLTDAVIEDLQKALPSCLINH